ncbi:MAG TPA: RDD family protein [Actinoplanes sp.]|nr:RDD family protein [Actinoplanes sp.]
MTEPLDRNRGPVTPPNPYSPPPGAAVQPYRHPGQVPQPYPVNATPRQVPVPYIRVDAGGRIGAALLDYVLTTVTFGIGWLIWACVTWSNGQSPAKSLLGHVVADAETGVPFDWGRMFLREFVIKGMLFGFLSLITLGVFGIVNACTVFRSDQRTLHDQMAGSVVRVG